MKESVSFENLGEEAQEELQNGFDPDEDDHDELEQEDEK